MLTTAAVARRAASLYDRIGVTRAAAVPVAGGVSPAAGSTMAPGAGAGADSGGRSRTNRCGSHSGRSVANVNSSASRIVTACAKTNQSFLSMTRRRGEGRTERGSAAAAVTAAELSACFEEVLGASRFADYCPNGLQVEGERPIRRLVSGVTASLALIRAAVDDGADALLVHHGWFWRGEDPRVTGTRRARLAEVLGHGLHLFAYHLPLDVHPQLGNNAQIAARMGWRVDGHAGEQDLIAWHDLARPASAAQVARKLGERLGREPLAVGALDRPIRRLAWCTGAAQDMLD